MSASLVDQPELPSSSSTATLSAVNSIRTANPGPYSPIDGVIGHSFIRLCLWFDLLSSWKDQSYSLPVDGSVDGSKAETEVVPHAAVS